jgi:hypothetical protein
MVKIRNFKIQTLRGRKLIFPYFCLLLFTFCLSASAQDAPADAEPPPLKMITKDEKTQLEAQTDMKRRTDLSLSLMDLRLKKAEDLFSKEDYSEMFTELGIFHALVDDTMDFLYRRDNGSKKVLNNFKKFELTLRSFLSRLELIRRDVPPKYEFYVRGLVKTVRDARTKAVEPLFSDTVVPNQKTEN